MQEGKEAAQQVSAVKIIAALTECSEEEEVKDAIIFFIANLAADVNAMLLEL